MTIEQLFGIINTAYSQNILSLSSMSLAGTSAAATINNHFSEGRMILNGASQPFIRDGAVFIESGVPHNITSLPASSTATTKWMIDGANVNMLITLIPSNQSQAGISLEGLFPKLYSLYSGHYRFSDIRFEIDSSIAAYDFDVLQNQYAQGLFRPALGTQYGGQLKFYAKFIWPPSLTKLAALFGNQRANCSGTWQLVNGIPRYYITIQGIPITMRSLQIVSTLNLFGLLTDSVAQPSPHTEPLADMLHIFKGECTLPPSLNPSNSLIFESTWQLAIPQIMEISSVNRVNTSSVLSTFCSALLQLNLPTWEPIPNLPLHQTFSLEKIEVGFNVQNLAINSFTSSFSLLDQAHSFTLIPNLLILSKISIELGFVSQGQTPNFYARLSGNLSIPNNAVNGSFITSISLPSGDFNIGLEEYSTINASQLTREVVPFLPPNLNIIVGELNLNGNFKSQSCTFVVELEPDSDIDFFLFKLQQLSFAFEYENNAFVTKKTVSAEVQSVLYINENIEISLFGSAGTDGWTLQGGIEVIGGLGLQEILPPNISLPQELRNWRFNEAEVTLQRGQTETIRFMLSGLAELDFGDLGKITGNSVEVNLSRLQNNTYHVQVKLGGAIKLFGVTGRPANPWLINLNGDLELNVSSGTNWELKFTPNNATQIGPLSIPIPKQITGNNVTLSTITVQPGIMTLSQVNNNWEFSLATIFKLDTFTFLNGLIPPNGIGVDLNINKNGNVWIASLELTNITPFVTNINIPERNNLPAINLGTTSFHLNNAKIFISSDLKLNFTADLNWFLPSRINHLFGVNAVGQPKHTFFKTYTGPGQPITDALSLSFTIGLNAHLHPSGSVTLNALPLDLVIAEPNGTHYTLNLGPIENGFGKYGAIRFIKPILNYDAINGFDIQLDFTILKDFAIPLDPIKELFKRGNLNNLNNLLPNTLPIPVKDPPLFWNGTSFNWEPLRQLFLKINREDLFNQIKEKLLPIQNRFSRLPDTLKDYLQYEGINGFALKLKISPTGNVEAGFEMKPADVNDTPELQNKKSSLNVLLVPVLPLAFFGVRLRKFYFGEIFGGQLFTFKIDADIDVFDMPSIIASFSDDPNVRQYIGDTSQFKRTIQLHDLRSYIIWQTEIPIVIPTFYTKLGVDYYGLGDVTFKTSFEFPEPTTFDLSQAAAFLSQLATFISNKNATMDVNENYGLMNARFKLGALYLKTGQKMGSKTIGWTEGQIFDIKEVSKILATLLNTLKNFNINGIIQSIPYKNRNKSGALISNFLGLNINGKSLLSTPFEFIQNNEWQAWGLTEAEKNQYLPILKDKNGNNITANTKGIALFLKGDASSRIGTLQPMFGLIAVEADKFVTGFRFDGTISNVINVNAAALVSINPPHFQVSGNFKLTLPVFNNVEIFNSALTYSNNTLNLSARLQILNSVNVLLSGSISSNSFTLNGQSSISYTSGSHVINLATINIGITQNAAVFNVRIFTFPSIATQLANRGGKLYLLGTAGSLQFYVDLQEPWKSKIGAWPSASGTLNVNCDYPQKNELLLIVTHLIHKIFPDANDSSQELVLNQHEHRDHRYHITVTRVTGKNKVNITIQRLNGSRDIFDEIKDKILGSIGEENWHNTIGNITNARFILKNITHNTLLSHPLPLEIYFPEAYDFEYGKFDSFIKYSDANFISNDIERQLNLEPPPITL